jgi:hypothetical protein
MAIFSTLKITLLSVIIKLKKSIETNKCSPIKENS